MTPQVLVCLRDSFNILEHFKPASYYCFNHLELCTFQRFDFIKPFPWSVLLKRWRCFARWPKLRLVPLSSKKFGVSGSLTVRRLPASASAECHNHHLPEDEPISLSECKAIYEQYGIRPKQIDEIADPYFYLDGWCRHQSAGAQACEFLDQLDFFSPKKLGLRKRDLQLVDGYHPGNDYLGVRSHDPLSASLLQARLLELNQKIAIEIVETP